MVRATGEKEHPDGYAVEEITHKNSGTDPNYKPKINWLPFIYYALLHLLSLGGIYVYFTEAKWETLGWGHLIGYLTGQSVVIGSHRGFCHRSFKANKLVQVILLTLQAMGGQESIYSWAKSHRVHHKYCDTDADPYNINRGFFFAHVGHLITLKHPSVVEKEAKIGVDDLESNELVMFQHKYFIPIHIIMGLLIPVLIPVYGWNETLLNSFLVCYCMRCMMVLNLSWCVNSVAHSYGAKPYDKRITASQSKAMWFMALGEGWHNFHHSFPWDYRSSETSMGDSTTVIIEQLARWGLVYDLKTATSDTIVGHVKRHGDGTHEFDVDENDPDAVSTVYRLLVLNTLNF